MYIALVVLHNLNQLIMLDKFHFSLLYRNHPKHKYSWIFEWPGILCVYFNVKHDYIEIHVLI